MFPCLPNIQASQKEEKRFPQKSLTIVLFCNLLGSQNVTFSGLSPFMDSPLQQYKLLNMKHEIVEKGLKLVKIDDKYYEKGQFLLNVV